ncbi:chemotaxis protein CheW [Halanaerocella petrolearia]
MDTDQFIVFEVGTEKFGIKITEVQEIIKPQQVTSLPRSADFIKGIIELRGEVIVIVNLGERLGIGEVAETEGRVLVVNINGVNAGLVVDDASDVVQINTDQIKSPQGNMAGIKTEYLSGVAKLDEELIILLDFEALFSDTQQAQLEEIAQENI